jgi:uncharacterized cupredoxin-like copper-binding protein
MAPPAPAPGKERTAAVDWQGTEVLSLVLDDYRFRPEDLVFEAGRPYHLRLINEGDHRHTFASEAFFRTIALRSRPAGDPEAMAASLGRPAMTSVEVEPGEEEELAFIPLKEGGYPFECSIFLHDFLGMTGEITVQAP